MSLGLDPLGLAPLGTQTEEPSSSGSHATSGGLSADAATIAGSSARSAVHATTGALSAAAATIAGASVHPHTTSGALTASAATIAGTSSRAAAGTHATTGALSAAAATIAGTAGHIAVHATSGGLVASSATLAGTSARVGIPVSHSTSGALVAGSATMSGAALLALIIETSPEDRAARRLQRRKTLRATASREVNLMWRRKEPADEREPFYREQVPGLTVFAEIGGGAYRGGWSTVARAFAVFGSGVYEITASGTYTLRGTLSTTTGPVDMVQGVGLIVMVDGPNGYVFTLGTNAFTKIADGDFLGSKRVGYLDGRFVFVKPDSQLFYWSQNIDDGSTFDALDFASAESAPDLIVGHVVDHREIWFLGEKTGEPWVSAPTSDGVPYQRNSGAIMETGCAATHSLHRLDNSIYWVGRDSNGEGMVFVSGGAGGYQPMRISDHSVEEVLNKSTDLAGCYAYTYQDAGQTFYCLQVPGASTTLIYDVSVKRWHERAELIGGNLAPWRVSGMLFAFGKHLAGGDDGVLYELDDYEYTYAGDVLYRNFVTPHTATPGLRHVYFSELELNITAGETASGMTPSIEMRYSNDGGKTWSNWMSRSAGLIGEYSRQPKWLRLGRAKDRVWEFRITDDCKTAIVGMSVDATEGAA